MGEQPESPLGQLKHLPYGDLYKAPTSHRQKNWIRLDT